MFCCVVWFVSSPKLILILQLIILELLPVFPSSVWCVTSPSAPQVEEHVGGDLGMGQTSEPLPWVIGLHGPPGDNVWVHGLMEGRELSLIDPSPQRNWHCWAERPAEEGVSLSAAPGFPSVQCPRWWWTAYQWLWLLTSWNIVSVYVMRVWPPAQLYSLARLSVVRTLTLAFPHSVQMNSFKFCMIIPFELCTTFGGHGQSLW